MGHWAWVMRSQHLFFFLIPLICPCSFPSHQSPVTITPYPQRGPRVPQSPIPTKAKVN
ncbi:hypothetical protein FDUTEX481_01368 [Tolypothrix sp. PCC 7601]|nr:hypothetical protein FDUTEX481_01368 [Tolypothrix sp. PCC 7601]